MASVVDICNSGLNLLGASTISALTDDSKNARLCNQRYENVRNRVFRSHAWNCLHKRVQLAQNSTAPVIEYSNAYALPSDCLRVLKIHNGTTDSIVSEIDYKIEGRNIVTNEGTVYLIYIAKITDPNLYEQNRNDVYILFKRRPMLLVGAACCTSGIRPSSHVRFAHKSNNSSTTLLCSPDQHCNIPTKGNTT